MMVEPFSIQQLIIPTFMIFFVGTLVLYSYSKNLLVSFLFAFIKSSIFFIYFYYFFDGSYTLLDDWHYIEQANTYISNQNDTLYLILHPWEFVYVFSDNHFLYQLWNVFSFYLYEPSYFAPVSLNIIVTFLTSLTMYKLLYIIGIRKKYATWFALFYVIYWNTLSWSSILNLKGFIVQFLVILLIYNIIVFDKFKKLLNLFYILIIVILFKTIRFYLPFLIGISYLVFKLFIYSNKFRGLNKIIMSIILVFLLNALFVLVAPYFQYEFQKLLEDFVNHIYGMFRFILTPIPFHIEKSYQCLTFSAIMTWLSFPFFIYGIYLIYIQKNRYFIFILICVLIILLFYASYGELQGPRHRIQLDPYISFFQLIGLLGMVYGKKIYRIFKCEN